MRAPMIARADAVACVESPVHTAARVTMRSPATSVRRAHAIASTHAAASARRAIDMGDLCMSALDYIVGPLDSAVGRWHRRPRGRAPRKQLKGERGEYAPTHHRFEITREAWSRGLRGSPQSVRRGAKRDVCDYSREIRGAIDCHRFRTT